MKIIQLDENERSEKEKRSWSAKCGHVTRRIFADEPLKGKTLKFALELLKSDDDSKDNIFNIISDKMKKGEVLSDYEKSFMEDIVLTHSKLFG